MADELWRRVSQSVGRFGLDKNAKSSADNSNLQAKTSGGKLEEERRERRSY
jgi:hypothetical protein